MERQERIEGRRGAIKPENSWVCYTSCPDHNQYRVVDRWKTNGCTVYLGVMLSLRDVKEELIVGKM